MAVSIRDALPSYVRADYEEIEQQQRISHEVENGEVLDLRKARGMFADFMKVQEKRDEFEELLAKMKKNSLDISVAVEIAKTLSKTLPLKSRTEVVERKIVERKKTVEKPMVLELPRIALHGGNLNKVMRWSAMRRLVNAEC